VSLASPTDDEMEVAPWGKGRLRINGREIAHIDDAKKRR
jgi:hypothetical protein